MKQAEKLKEVRAKFGVWRGRSSRVMNPNEATWVVPHDVHEPVYIVKVNKGWRNRGF